MKQKYLLIGILVVLSTLPLVVSVVRNENQDKLSDGDAYLGGERYVKIHTDRVENCIREIQSENLETSFSHLVDEQQYFYPGYSSDIKGVPKDMETLLSSRRFLKVFQQFQSISATQANIVVDRFCRLAVVEYRDVVLSIRNQYVTGAVLSDPKSLMGTKYMVCVSMLLAARLGNCQKVWNQIEAMNKIIQEEIRYIKDNKDIFPHGFEELGILAMSLDRECIVSVLMYALKCAHITSEPIVLLRKKLLIKEIPLTKWDAEITYYDIPHQQGYFQIDKKAIFENFIVYSMPRNNGDRTVIYDDIVKLFTSELTSKFE